MTPPASVPSGLREKELWSPSFALWRLGFACARTLPRGAKPAEPLQQPPPANWGPALLPLQKWGPPCDSRRPRPTPRCPSAGQNSSWKLSPPLKKRKCCVSIGSRAMGDVSLGRNRLPLGYNAFKQTAESLALPGARKTCFVLVHFFFRAYSFSFAPS